MTHGWKALALLGCIVFTLPASAAQLVVDGNGRLRGADDVRVGAGLYSVRFVELSCFEVYPDCKESTIFPFPDPFFALAASRALVDQVFLDGPDGLFDGEPRLTYGCPGIGSFDLDCEAFTFYGATGGQDEGALTGNGLAFVAVNTRRNDGVGSTSVYGLYDFGGPLVAPDRTMAVWSGPAWQASEPGTLALLCLGLAGIGLSRRRKVA